LTPVHVAERLTAELARCLERGEGYRFGDSTVVSRRVHLVASERPGDVDIVTDADAGRVFYHRRSEGQILHIDIFHEVAEVDHREVATRLRTAVGRYARDFKRAEISGGATSGGVSLANRRLADYVDIQTATGGGRITGGLSYGRGQTLQRAHLTHVHVAVLARERDLDMVPYLIMAVEDAVRRQGHEIRRPDRLNHISSRDQGVPVDLSDYAAPSDSLLREPRCDWSSPRDSSDAVCPGYLRGILDLADEFGGMEELRDILETLSHRATWSQLYKKLRNRVPLNQLLNRLEGEGLVESERGLHNLTRNGHILHDFITRHRRDLEFRFRRTLRKLPFTGRPSRKPVVPSSSVRPRGRGPVTSRRVEPAEAGGWVGSLGVPETVVKALTRRLVERRQGPGSASPGVPAPFCLSREDLLVHSRRGLAGLDICLVIDASASMAGTRMRAAKYLAQHLLLSTRDRVAVVVFQEREAGLYVPFTRSFEEVQSGLRRIRPLGLTPLAEGLMQALDYVRGQRSRNPLLLLITDGIPTVPRWTMNPVVDAQSAAARLARERICFSCIGLEPNRGFLRELAAAARGTLHIVDELEQTLLSEIAHSERRRIRL